MSEYVTASSEHASVLAEWMIRHMTGPVNDSGTHIFPPDVTADEIQYLANGITEAQLANCPYPHLPWDKD